ncbi:MAG: hypothetical protein R2789_01765 [Microthrixaceae bacterium]
MSFAELLGLTSLAVAQPVLSVFGNDASAFVSYGASSLDIIAFALIVVLAPPVGLWIVEQLIGLFGDGPRRVAHLGFIALLVVIFLSRVFPPGIISVVLLLGAAVGATVLVARTTAASQFLRYLAFSPLLFLAVPGVLTGGVAGVRKRPPGGGIPRGRRPSTDPDHRARRTPDELAARR